MPSCAAGHDSSSFRGISCPLGKPPYLTNYVAPHFDMKACTTVKKGVTIVVTERPGSSLFSLNEGLSLAVLSAVKNNLHIVVTRDALILAEDWQDNGIDLNNDEELQLHVDSILADLTKQLDQRFSSDDHNPVKSVKIHEMKPAYLHFHNGRIF